TAEDGTWVAFFASFQVQGNQNLANFSAIQNAMRPQISTPIAIYQGRLRYTNGVSKQRLANQKDIL
ncbi:MAG TPA: hypothetical protein VGK58_09720, partial [Lacipirellulaceae bacterium]